MTRRGNHELVVNGSGSVVAFELDLMSFLNRYASMFMVSSTYRVKCSDSWLQNRVLLTAGFFDSSRHGILHMECARAFSHSALPSLVRVMPIFLFRSWRVISGV